MMNDNLDPIEQRLKQYYEGQSLPLDALVELEETIAETVSESKVALNPQWRWFSIRMQPVAQFAAVAAALLLAIGLAYYVVDRQTSSQTLESVAAEIALNHAKQFDSEFFPTSIPSLAHSMDLLDFAPVLPKKLQLERYQINGARYCTIDSAIAVQVRLQDEANREYTLYEFRGHDWLAIEGEEVISVGNIQVTLWQEGSVMMGLAHRVHEL